MRHIVLSIVCALTLVACGAGRTPGTCTTKSECPASHVCIDAACILTCDSTADCAGGTVCNAGGLCVTPSGAPLIDNVYGLGSELCYQSEGDRCFEDRLAVQGEGLLGAAYKLVGAQTFNLNIVGSPNDQLVHVQLPSSLTTGEYRLVATNAAGDNEVGVRILQGEPGPDASGTSLIERLNEQATTGRFVVDRMPTANEIIQHLNGGSLKLSGDVLPPGNGGTEYTDDQIVGLVNSASTKIASQRVNYSGADLIAAINNASVGQIAAARVEEGGGGSGGSSARLMKTDSTADASAVVVTKAEMDALCADGDGCNISIGYTGFDFDGTGTAYTPSASIIWGPTCRLGLTSAGDWTLPAWCDQMWSVWNGVPDPNAGFAWFRTYASGHQGKNNDSVNGTLLRYFARDKFACSFADYNTSNGTDTAVGSGDNDTNFYFWLHNPVGTAENAPATGYFTGTRSCHLLIED